MPMAKSKATPILRDLQIFTLAANTRNFSATAEKVGMTHAAVSKSIKRLEGVFGTKMFERTGRGVALTMTGRSIYQHSQSVDDLINVIHSEVADMNAASTGLVRLGASPAMIDNVVVPAVTRLISGPSAVRVDLHTQTSGRLLEELQSGSLDMAVAIVPPKVSSDLKFDRLGAKRNFIVSRLGHPILRKSFKLDDLVRQKWLLAPPDAHWISNIFAEANLTAPSIMVRTDASPSVLAALLTNSDLLSVLDTSMLSPTAATALAVLPAPAPASDLRFALFWRRHAYFSEAMKRCRLELRRSYKAIS